MGEYYENKKNSNKYIKEFYKDNNVNMVLAYFMSAGDAFSNIAIAFVMKLLLDVSLINDSKKFINTVCIVSLFLVCDLIITYSNRYLYNKFSRKAITQYKDKVFFDILDKNINSFNNETTSKYLSAFSNDVEIIEKNYLKGSVDIFNKSVLLIGGLVSMIYLNYKLTLLVVLASSTSWLVTFIIGPKLVPLEKETSLGNEKFMNLTKNMLSGFTVIKSFKAENEVLNYFSDSNRKLEKLKNSKKMTADAIAVLSRSASLLTDFIVFTIGIYFVLKGAISFGVIIAFVQLLNYVITPLQKLGPLYSKKKAAMGLIDKLSDNIFNEEKNETSSNCIFSDKIIYNDVSFSYDDKNYVLDSINLIFEKGKSYAIVGNSGSGKSTLINLLLGYSNKYSGEIRIDNKELKECSVSSLYDLFSTIQQNVFIFDDTILNNITMYKTFSSKEIERAIQQAGLYELIKSKGYNYICGENGCNLSGGEKQRISIARCLLRKNPVVLMDEATSSLDIVTSLEIEKQLLYLENTTKIVITHKLEKELLKIYDQIIVMLHGKIVEIGTYDELVSESSYFISLYNVANELVEENLYSC